MGSRFRVLSVIESTGSSTRFNELCRMPADDEEDLRTWMLRMLRASRCPLGLYVAESGEGEKVDTDLWLAWDGALTFSIDE